MRVFLQVISILLVLVGTFQSFAAPPTINMMVPENFKTPYSFSRIRLGGYTEPDNKITINGERTKVYSTGAFIGMLPLQPGLNNLTIVATAPDGTKTELKKIIRRTPPIQTSPTNILEFDKSIISPSVNMNLVAGDIIEVKIKGTPDCQASFTIGSKIKDIPMIEVNEGTIKGIYKGVYVIKPLDKIDPSPVKFKLTKTSLGSTTALSKGLITVDPDAWPKVGKITDPHAALKTSLGDARLGGAEFDYLPVGTQLQLTGKVGEAYKVHLSPTMTAYISEENIKVLPDGTPMPRSTIDAISISKNDDADYMKISLSTRIPFYIEPVGNPNRLLINFFGASSNVTWITDWRTTKVIDSVVWHVMDKEWVQIEVSLNGQYIWGYDGDYEEDSNTFSLRVKHPPILPAPPESPFKGIKISIDPGHGGSNRGALGNAGSKEKDINLGLSNELKKLLVNAGANVFMTREKDDYLDNDDRWDKVIEEDPCISISIHCNSIGLASDPSKSYGFGTFYKYLCYRPITISVYDAMKELDLEPRGNIGSFNSRIVKTHEMISFLVETAFMSHPEDEAKLLDRDFQKECAKAFFKGMENFLKTEQRVQFPVAD